MRINTTKQFGLKSHFTFDRRLKADLSSRSSQAARTFCAKMGDCLRLVASFNIARYVGGIYRLICRRGRVTGEGTRARRKRRGWSLCLMMVRISTDTTRRHLDIDDRWVGVAVRDVTDRNNVAPRRRTGECQEWRNVYVAGGAAPTSLWRHRVVDGEKCQRIAARMSVTFARFTEILGERVNK